jgi:hypothetical protein
MGPNDDQVRAEVSYGVDDAMGRIALPHLCLDSRKTCGAPRPAVEQIPS